MIVSSAAVPADAAGVRQVSRNKVPVRPAASPFARLSTALIYAVIGTFLGFSWLFRHESLLTAKSGLGYALGIAGVVATVLLLAYPLRKRIKLLRGRGSVATWFHFHMLLGILAPVLILLHANFRFGSLNSAVALTSMLVVAASGVIGRFIYSRTHFGLYGARATVEQLREIISSDRSRVGAVLSSAPQMRDRLFDFATAALSPTNHILVATGRILFISFRIRRIRFMSFRTVSREVKQAARHSEWSRAKQSREKRKARKFIEHYLSSIRKAVQLSFYERLFSLWHVLHIPLFFMLVIATMVHVLAVHMY